MSAVLSRGHWFAAQVARLGHVYITDVNASTIRRVSNIAAEMVLSRDEMTVLMLVMTAHGRGSAHFCISTWSTPVLSFISSGQWLEVMALHLMLVL